MINCKLRILCLILDFKLEVEISVNNEVHVYLTCWGFGGINLLFELIKKFIEEIWAL